MENKLKHDATDSISGVLYQFYIALDYCFNLKTNETLFIEKYGDITISQSKQIEVKKYKEALTDSHENIWKTLNNWLQDEFNPSNYKELILLTTQSFGNNSTFKGWNDKTIEQKQQVLNNIGDLYKEKTTKSTEKEKLILTVLSDSNSQKLKTILEKFVILDCSLRGEDYWEAMKDTRSAHIPIQNRDKYMNALLGFIIAPETVNSNGWEISYNGFAAQTKMLSEQYSAITKIFPLINCNITNEDISSKSQHLFVKKIKDICYDEVIGEAISDYIKTSQLILTELSSYSISKSSYEAYEDDLNSFYQSKYRLASRNGTGDTEKDSQNFYDEIALSATQNFLNFNNTPYFFRNGTLHNMANNEKQNIEWNIDKKG